MGVSRTNSICLATAFALAFSGGQAMAQEAVEDAPALFVELNSAAPLDGACRLTFMATNGLGTQVDKLVLETVLLTKGGVVERLTLFDLQTLPVSRPRVRQFDVPGLECGNLGQVLINGIQACDGEGLDPATCTDKLELSTRSDVEVIG
ncbi:hypothetical protein [Pseudoruegeria sp. HB172150]|uniref:hypothetical protein n=1 Tax=Pseudoruegeria sp. HB172150 TaxID=2721164 RepID=UPI0020A6D237|nr:hypothetical protein [Pseudoruegeria sp. HB172150]